MQLTSERIEPMRDLAPFFVVLPMPILWLLLFAVALSPWTRASRAIFIGTTVIFFALCIPAVGNLLTAPLSADPTPLGGHADVAAIVVPSAGTFEDGAGQWWPKRGSIERMATGMRLHSELDLPLIIAGGSPLPDQPPEAETIAALFRLRGPEIMLETTSRNTGEAGAAVAAIVSRLPGRTVILVTSETHIARTSASLRHHGLGVVAMPAIVPERESPIGLAAEFLPGHEGFTLSRAALWEYVGILWYLLTGRIDLADLSPDGH